MNIFCSTLSPQTNFYLQTKEIASEIALYVKYWWVITKSGHTWRSPTPLSAQRRAYTVTRLWPVISVDTIEKAMHAGRLIPPICRAGHLCQRAISQIEQCPFCHWLSQLLSFIRVVFFFLSRTLAIRLLREEGAVFGKDKYVMTVSTVLELLSILTTGHSSTAWLVSITQIYFFKANMLSIKVRPMMPHER